MVSKRFPDSQKCAQNDKKWPCFKGAPWIENKIFLTFYFCIVFPTLMANSWQNPRTVSILTSENSSFKVEICVKKNGHFCPLKIGGNSGTQGRAPSPISPWVFHPRCCPGCHNDPIDVSFNSMYWLMPILKVVVLYGTKSDGRSWFSKLSVLLRQNQSDPHLRRSTSMSVWKFSALDGAIESRHLQATRVPWASL